MATDVARVSFDPARSYRGVVPQQGRVSLEAEQNEQRVIDADERRKELLDIVGPAGTPDDGYAISGGVDFTIGAGTMYVGGLRVELDEDITYSKQPDWLDHPGFDIGEKTREHIVLLLQDTDVTAVEDPALYEVALGGPDGAARTRLLQHVERLRTEADTCADALAQDVKLWDQDGLTFDPATMQLQSDSRLLVTWEGDPEPANPCEPSGTGGYLGAENQLIRIQITAVGRDGTLDLIWGYDDASFLYRVSADASANPVLTLDRTPSDDYHRPRAGQAVQALRATADLQGTDGVIEGYVAALGGEVAVLTAPYDPDTKTVQFPAPLPSDYLDQNENPQLFLRIWEEQLTGLQLGTPVSLTGTGMQVTITSTTNGPLHVDDFWCVGVRPSTPTTVYPVRYLRTPQPPDGPHLWVCPLAVIEWDHEELVVLEDCRNHFKPLTELDSEGCCTIEVRASDAAADRLQALIDRATAGRIVSERAGRVTVCFAPGRYELAEPLVLRKNHSNLTLRGCNDAAVITVRPGDEAAFGHGLIVLVDVDNVTITGFEFELPQVPATLARVQGSTGGVLNRETVRAINAEVGSRYVSIAIRAINCAVLEVDKCLFRFTLGEHRTTPEIAQTMPRDVFGVGVFAAGGCWGVRLRDNRFLHDPEVPQGTDGRPLHYLIGYLLTPTAVAVARDARNTRSLGSARLRALIEDAEIRGNEFHGITAAVVIEAELGGVGVWDNIIADCYSGIWITDTTAAVNTDLAGAYKLTNASAGDVGLAHDAFTGGLLDPILMRILVIAMLYPLPRPTDLVVHGTAQFEAADIAKLRQDSAETRQAFMSGIFSRIAAEHPATPETGAATKEAKGAKPVEFKASAAAPAPIPVSSNLLTIWAGLAELGRLQKLVEGLHPSVGVERNAVDCAVPQDGTTGPALFLFTGLPDTSGSSVSVTSNRLTSRHANMSAAVIGASAATVTGNTIAAAVAGALALGVASVGAVAITGNVIKGGVLMPVNRPFPAPLDTWQPLNTIV